MTIQIYNTLTRKKEPFIPIEEGKVSMYVMWTDRLQLHPHRQCAACYCF